MIDLLMIDLKDVLQRECYGKDLEQRKGWYSAAATAYQQTRPRYPQALLQQVMDLVPLSSTSRILEVGCGPAIATPPFAALGCTMTCLEPNPDFWRQAQRVCEPYPNVTLQNCAFEEWTLEPQTFDAVLAASSFHWIPPDIGYPKAAAALKPSGSFILLWNKELQPQPALYQDLMAVYNTYAPALQRPYETLETQLDILNALGQMAIASGHFKEMVSGHQVVEVTYTVEQYLRLLTTYSPFAKLEPSLKALVLEALRQVLMGQGDTLDLSYVSAFHWVRPVLI